MAILTKPKPTIVKLTMVKLFRIVKLLTANLAIIKLNMAKKMME
jgi:hypothetical protein